MTWLALFIAITLLLMLMPLLPAIFEWQRATDVQPLRVVQEYDTDVTHFASGFKAYLEKNFGSFFAAAPTSEFAFQEGVLRDGTNFQVVKTGGAPSFTHKEVSKSNTNKLVLAFSPVVFPEKMFFETEVYSNSNIKTGAFSHFRALLGEDNVEIGERCTVLRWVHASNALYIGAGSTLFGRASAGQALYIGDNCHFERLNAPRIVFGQPMHITPWNGTGLTQITELPSVKDIYKDRWVINGEVELPARSLFVGDLISAKRMEIGDGSHITGSLKSNKSVHIGKGVRVDGAVFSTGSIYIEAGAQILGPVVAEGTLIIEQGTVIGTEALQTTVSGAQIIVAPGVVLHGTIWADESALVSHPSKGRA